MEDITCGLKARDYFFFEREEAPSRFFSLILADLTGPKKTSALGPYRKD
jgi:hypothetical protein